ncbi:MAG: hypothetical protein HQK83_13310 [Fibrobacteria bacterium]|nr:hypothetical protein [Fibrobacteria bacterium]
MHQTNFLFPSVPENIFEGVFLCPECGHDGRDGYSIIEIDELFAPFAKVIQDPWNDVTTVTFCLQCGFSVPAQLSLHWGGITPKEAKREWQKKYFPLPL